MGPLRAPAGSEVLVHAVQVGLEVDLDRVQVGDVERLEAHAVAVDGQLEAALEVVLVVDPSEAGA